MLTKVIDESTKRTLIDILVKKFRYDQLMRLGWKYLLPLAVLNLLITGIVLVALGNI